MAAGAGLFILPAGFSRGIFAAPVKTRVSVIRNRQMRNALGVTNKTEVKRAVYEALRALSDDGSGEEVLKSIISPKDIVGIKVNVYLGDKDNATRPEVADSLAEFLIKSGVNDNNIIIWDRAADELEQAGYVINDGKKGVRCWATDSKRIQRLSKPMAGFDNKDVSVGAAVTRVSNIASKICNVMVNMPPLRTFKFKEHTGVGNAIMNMYGAVEITDSNTQALYGNDCNPGAAEIYSINSIKNKTKLVLCDAIYPLYNGGPSEDKRYHWNYNGIIAGFDPVAVDIVAQGIIQKYREKAIPEALPLRSDYLDVCADAKYRLGTAILKDIEVVEKDI